MPAARREPVPNVDLYNARDAQGETQEQTADALNRLARGRSEATAITGNHVSRWERGIVHPSRLHSQLLAEHFGRTLAELGLTRQRQSPAAHQPDETIDSDVLLIEHLSDAEVEQPVITSQQEWMRTRRRLNTDHLRLAQTAAQLYPESARITSLGLLSRPDWTFPEPVDLDAITLIYNGRAASPTVKGNEPFASHVRPLHAIGGRYQRYSQAIRDIARPTLFENRYSWRLVDVDLGDDGGQLAFGDMNYFDAMDISEAVAHETAVVHQDNDGSLAPATWRGLHLRSAIGDPFDLSRRAAVLSINTLTIRRDSTSASVILHSRNAANVATSGGIIGVMPAGVFQPSTVRAGDHHQDFNLWRNIMREYSEEFLGNPEHDGDGPGADYTTEPFRSMDAARAAGRVRVFALGLAIGALDLWAGLETVAVFDADVFDEFFANLVHVNDEGTVVRIGRNQPTVHVPFTHEVIEDLWASGRLAPETGYSLRRAWQFRGSVLG
jgi:transcriptional regulator with XRE-family HTH domain